MPRADYYILAEADHDSRERFLCRLCEKILGLNMNIYIHAGSEIEARRLDSHLWSFRDESFIPHALIDDKPVSPITIGFDQRRPSHRDVFVNLARELPEEAFEYQRVVEVIIQSPEVLEATRQNYRLCREKGFEVFHQDMRQR